EITVLFKNSPEIWKVKEEVEKNPTIAAWRQTDEWKELNDGSINIYSKTAPPAEENEE
ncbi:hypothetical protein BG004_001349, partial [Podila humilis]